MKRLTLIALALSMTTACASKDGTWLLFTTLTANSAYEDDPDIGVEYRVLSTMASTKEGTLVMNYDGVLMTGAAGEKDAFEVGMEAGTDYSGEDCATAIVKTDWECKGLFTKDGGLEATVTRADKMVVADCPNFGDDRDETDTRSWKVTGVRVNANDNAHLGDANWGYIPPSPISVY
ncbi:MAG: hypothetical protein GY913_20410 [Proteobacteria bacterium]|nr:hypothetical protein [Pseudomonadota bacterium]MCP4919271.1 hypothetical protein [Pseudomonadota bacterium]